MAATPYWQGSKCRQYTRCNMSQCLPKSRGDTSEGHCRGLGEKGGIVTNQLG